LAWQFMPDKRHGRANTVPNWSCSIR
jgi:hypothetical protein